jgi:hypothetical protein
LSGAELAIICGGFKGLMAAAILEFETTQANVNLSTAYRNGALRVSHPHIFYSD